MTKRDYSRIAGRIGTSAKALGAQELTGQPGYRRGEEMSVLRTQSGGYRLYVRICNKWMDASLQDL